MNTEEPEVNQKPGMMMTKYPVPVWKPNGDLDRIEWIKESEITSYKVVAQLIGSLKREAESLKQQKKKDGSKQSAKAEMQLTSVSSNIPFQILRNEPKGYKVEIASEGETGGFGEEGYVVAVFGYGDTAAYKTALVSTPNGVWEKKLENLKLIGAPLDEPEEEQKEEASTGESDK
ncbi:MAG: hypothetical protein JRN21_09640 [Nitrososphaerota archaeon]|nr:hypothetical protein [Nitrososphaerota archaeon]